MGQYWDTWFDAQRKAMEEQTKTFAGIQSQWGDFFKQWQTTACGSTPQQGPAMFRDMFCKAGENFIQMMEQFYQSTGKSQAPADAAKSWMSSMQKMMEQTLQSSGMPFDPAQNFQKFMSQFGGAFTGGPASWASAFKNPFFGDMASHQATSSLFDPFGFYASIPGIGYTREKQEQANKLYKLFVDYEAKMREYNAEMTKVGLQALHRFNDYLHNPPADAAPLESLKQIYAKWVDVCEEVYAKYAVSDDYTRLYGDTVNALMAFKKQLHAVTDDMADQFNLPTRSEVDSLHQRVQELRRDNIRLKQAMAHILNALEGEYDMEEEGCDAEEMPAPAKAKPAAKASSGKSKSKAQKGKKK